MFSNVRIYDDTADLSSVYSDWGDVEFRMGLSSHLGEKSELEVNRKGR